MCTIVYNQKNWPPTLLTSLPESRCSPVPAPNDGAPASRARIRMSEACRGPRAGGSRGSESLR